MPFCPTPLDMFLVTVCYNKYDCYCGYCPLSSVFWKCVLFPATDGCLREHIHNLKRKELISLVCMVVIVWVGMEEGITNKPAWLV